MSARISEDEEMALSFPRISSEPTPPFWCITPKVYGRGGLNYNWGRITEIVAENGRWVRVASSPLSWAFRYPMRKFDDEFMFAKIKTDTTTELWMKKKAVENNG